MLIRQARSHVDFLVACILLVVRSIPPENEIRRMGVILMADTPVVGRLLLSLRKAEKSVSKSRFSSTPTASDFVFFEMADRR